jgi:DNA replication and repair protein RecF
MLSIKLATFDIAKTDFGESPVLLLDDVFSELDEGRQAALLNRARGAQCFITTAVPVKSTAGAVYTVANGAVTTALESR